MNSNYPTTLELISSVRNKQIASGANMTRKELFCIFMPLQKDIESERNVSSSQIFNNASMGCISIFKIKICLLAVLGARVLTT